MATDYLTLQEVADLLRVDRKTIRAMMDRTPEEQCCWLNVGGEGTHATAAVFKMSIRLSRYA